jgi:hypothetical protein
MEVRMPIEEPKIHVGLAINGERVTLMVSRSDGSGLPSRMNWDLHDIEHEGYLALCQRVGNTVTRMLAGAHPDAFAKFPLLVPPKLSPLDDLHDVVLSLMHRSITEKTTDYADALEALFKRNADDIEQTSFVENWEEYKLAIEHYQKQ